MSVTKDFSKCMNAKVQYESDEEISFSYPGTFDANLQKTIRSFCFLNRPRPPNSSEFYKRFLKISKFSNYSLFYGWTNGKSMNKKKISLIICKPNPSDDEDVFHDITLNDINSFASEDDILSYVFPIPDSWNGPVTLKVKDRKSVV